MTKTGYIPGYSVSYLLLYKRYRGTGWTCLEVWLLPAEGDV